MSFCIPYYITEIYLYVIYIYIEIICLNYPLFFYTGILYSWYLDLIYLAW